MGFALSYKRWRHKKGYGVHSPFAYSLIKDLSAKPGSYYKDKMMSKLMGAKYTYTHRQGRLLHRLIARLDPSVIVMPEEGYSEEWVIAITFANSKANIIKDFPNTPFENVLVVVSAPYVNSHPDEMALLLSCERGILMTFGEPSEIAEARRFIQHIIPRGWGLIDKKTALFIASSDSPYIDYDVKLV